MDISIFNPPLDENIDITDISTLRFSRYIGHIDGYLKINKNSENILFFYIFGNKLNQI